MVQEPSLAQEWLDTRPVGTTIDADGQLVYPTAGDSGSSDADKLGSSAASEEEAKKGGESGEEHPLIQESLDRQKGKGVASQ